MRVEGPARTPGNMRLRAAMWVLSAAVIFAAGAAPAAQGQELAVENPLAVDRPPEVVEVRLDEVLARLHMASGQAASLVAEDAASGKRIPLQIATEGAPARLLLLVELKARGRMLIRLRSDPSAPALPSLVFGRAVPERKDDFAWENRQVTYRIYGPALEATGEIGSGIDVWSKRIPNLVIDSFYGRDAEGARTHNPALSYHKDNGVGLDSYDVGASRGCGGTALYAGGRLIASKNYTHIRILERGPIRFSFQVTYAPWSAEGVELSETRRITLDAGSHLNRIESTFTFAGEATLDFAAGVAVHAGAAAELPVAGSVASVWDTPQDPSAGRIATGLVAVPAEHARSVAAAAHALLIFPRRSGEPFTYYAGSAWSKADMPTASSWNRSLMLQLQMLEHPLTVRWRAR